MSHMDFVHEYLLIAWIPILKSNGVIDIFDTFWKGYTKAYRD